MVFRRVFGIGRLSPEAFAKLVMDTGRRLDRFEDPSIDLEAFVIRDARGGVLNLSNIYRTFCQLARTDRLPFVENALGGMSTDEVVTNWEDVATSLLPVLRHGGYLRLAELHRLELEAPAAAGALIARRPFVRSLFTTVVVDTEHHMHLVGDANLERWGRSIDEVLEVAISNLRRISDEPFEAIGPGLWSAPWRDSYAAARLVCPEILQRVCTDPLVCVPTRDLVFVAQPDADTLTMLVELLAKVAEDAAYPLTSAIYRLSGKQLEEAPVPPDHPAYAAHRRLMLTETAGYYAEEKQRVEDNADEDVFYASYFAYERPDGELYSGCVWTDSVDTLLPPADVIAMQRLTEGNELEKRWEVPWAACVAEPGLLEQTDSPLPRWRTQKFPSDAWLDAHDLAGTR